MKTEHSHVTVTTPGRLHFGFLDLAQRCRDDAKSDPADRFFGSFGMTISGCGLRLRAAIADTVRIIAKDDRTAQLKDFKKTAGRAERLARQFLHHQGIETGAVITLDRIMPRHAGLGSGTQLAMAVGSALNALYHRSLSHRAIASILDRGKRSGIGIGAFDHGGVLTDGGVVDGQPPVITTKMAWPTPWRVLLIFDDRLSGIHGPGERRVFDRIAPYQKEGSEALCRLLLLDIIPALIRHDFPRFARGITRMQIQIGDHFARYQGARYTSPTIAELFTRAEQWGFSGYGQSSWGPTSFILCPDPQTAQDLARRIRSAPAHRDLRVAVHKGRNRGRRLTTGISGPK